MILICADATNEVAKSLSRYLAVSRIPHALLALKAENEMHYGIEKGELVLPGSRVPLNAVTAVVNLGLSGREGRRSFSALPTYLFGLLESRPLIWMNSRLAVASGEDRLEGMRLAQEAGFICAETWITNDPIELSVGAPSASPLVVKSFVATATGSGRDGASILCPPFSFDLPSLRIPALYQSVLKPLYQLRLTCIGREVLAARLEANHGEFGVDSRDALRAGKRYQKISADPELVAMCHQLMRAIGCEYLAADAGQLPSGEWCLFDINLLNDFYWIERYCPEVSLSPSIARLLQGQTSLLGPITLGLT